MACSEALAAAVRAILEVSHAQAHLACTAEQGCPWAVLRQALDDDDRLASAAVTPPTVAGPAQDADVA